jgi:hypothetical protein
LRTVHCSATAREEREVEEILLRFERRADKPDERREEQQRQREDAQVQDDAADDCYADGSPVGGGGQPA